MSINLENGLWRCFSSGEKGNVYSLIKLLENSTYTQARVKAHQWNIVTFDWVEEHLEKPKEIRFEGFDTESWTPFPGLEDGYTKEDLAKLKEVGVI